MPGVTHIALRVEDLRAAEALYVQLFGLTVAWREAETADGWRTLPASKTWDDAAAAKVSLGLVMLHRDGFALAVEAATPVAAAGTLSHIGLLVEEEELPRLRERALALGCQLVHDYPRTLVFDDPLGVRWEPTTVAYTQPEQLSTGARTGKWLDV